MSQIVTKVFVRVRENLRGQTMTEYALILSAVAVVCFLAYKTMGGQISTLAGNIGTDL
ncbi:MAG: Flp family type IVb pilin [Candidatus Binataceae bacterium]|nr:Flp family type IVb pilin [Candidatus Binataceae bacterium]